MLKFLFDEIPESGQEVAEDLGRTWVQPLVGPQFYPASEPVRATFFLMRAGPSVVVRGKLAGPLGFVCSRCAEEAPFAVAHEFTHVFVKGEHSGAIPEGFEESESLEFTFFNGETVDLEPLAGEELVMAVPQVPLCSESCKGICQNCGKNLNEGPCECHADVVDPRWARLREIKL